jgi:hypothetical protein
MAESILLNHDKTTLRNMAIERGLTSHGFNGRNMSRMRKQDLVDFIVYKDHSTHIETVSVDSPESNHNNSNEHSNGTQESNNLNEILEMSSSSEDEMISIFEELLVDDSLQPIIHIMDALYGLEHTGNFFDKNKEKPSLERIPNEEDETVPNLILQDVITSKNTCDINCDCQICQKNNNIIEENLKVQLNVRDLEARITCVICRCNVRNVIFIPCSHLATCITCSKNPLLDKRCPLCRKVYMYTNRVFC